MCTMISLTTPITGSGKGTGGWFSVSQANVGYDHAAHAQLEHALLLDFVNPDLGTGARVAVEMDIASGKALLAQLQAAIEAAEATGRAAPHQQGQAPASLNPANPGHAVGRWKLMAGRPLARVSCRGGRRRWPMVICSPPEPALLGDAARLGCLDRGLKLGQQRLARRDVHLDGDARTRPEVWIDEVK
ncbi:MAG TPA: DUF6295 family protein [Dehalococcoidia bacterium]|nr:DUF6295 family protein [Dehalococcoidia bacterium]